MPVRKLYPFATISLLALCSISASAMTTSDRARLDAICQAQKALPQRSMNDLQNAYKDPVFDILKNAKTPEALAALDADTLYQFGEFYHCLGLDNFANGYLKNAATKGDIRAMKARAPYTDELFWLKKAADTGDAEAELEYATGLEKLSKGGYDSQPLVKDAIKQFYTETDPTKILAESVQWYKAAAAQSGPYQAPALAALTRIGGPTLAAVNPASAPVQREQTPRASVTSATQTASSWWCFFGCSDASKPDKSDAVEQIKKFLTPDDSSYSITNVRYDNGYQQDPNNYVVSVTYTTVFNKSAREIVDDMGKSGRQGSAIPIVGAMVFMSMYGDAKPGDKFEESGTYSFLKTEKGWFLKSR